MWHVTDNRCGLKMLFATLLIIIMHNFLNRYVTYELDVLLLFCPRM